MSENYRQLLKAVGSQDKSLQKKALFSFRHLNRKSVIGFLSDTIKTNPNYRMRLWATQVLGELNDTRTIPLLTQLLQTTPMWPSAAYALGKFDDPSLIPVLIASLASPYKNMSQGMAQRVVIKVILGFGEPAILQLLEALNDPNLCNSATLALGKAKEKRAVKPLIKILQTSILSDAQREATLHALSQIKDPTGM